MSHICQNLVFNFTVSNIEDNIRLDCRRCITSNKQNVFTTHMYIHTNTNCRDLSKCQICQLQHIKTVLLVLWLKLLCHLLISPQSSDLWTGSRLTDASTTNSSHSPIKSSQLTKLTTYTIWSLYKCQIYQRQHIQNSPARTVVKTPMSSLDITSILRSLNWLKINRCIDYKLLSLTHKVITTNQPACWTYTELRGQWRLFLFQFPVFIFSGFWLRVLD